MLRHFISCRTRILRVVSEGRRGANERLVSRIMAGSRMEEMGPRQLLAIIGHMACYQNSIRSGFGTMRGRHACLLGSQDVFESSESQRNDTATSVQEQKHKRTVGVWIALIPYTQGSGGFVFMSTPPPPFASSPRSDSEADILIQLSGRQAPSRIYSRPARLRIRRRLCLLQCLHYIPTKLASMNSERL